MITIKLQNANLSRAATELHYEIISLLSDFEKNTGYEVIGIKINDEFFKDSTGYINLFSLDVKDNSNNLIKGK